LPILSLHFFFNHPSPTKIYTLSLHDALPIWWREYNTNIALRREDVNRHGRQVKADVPTAVLRQANLTVLHLSLPSFALQLPDHFHDLAQSCCPNRVSSSQQPS